MSDVRVAPAKAADDRRLLEFRGRIGVRELSAHVRLVAGDEERFRAELYRATYGRVVAESLRATPHKGYRNEALIASDDLDVVQLTYARRGALTAHQDGRTGAFGPGQLFLLRSRTTYHYVASSPSDVVAVSLPLDLLPGQSVRLLRQVTASHLAPTPMARGTRAFLQELLRGQHQMEETETVELVNALAMLVNALVVENSLMQVNDDESETMRLERAHQFIRANADSKDLSPMAVAEAINVSLRSLYRLFGSEGTTVTEYIRQVRLERLAQALTLRATDESIQKLAVQLGFSGVSQAARAFKSQYGLTMRDYRLLSRQ